MTKSVKRAKSKRPFVGILVVVAIVGIGALGYAMSRPRPGARPVDPNLVPGTAEGYLVGNADAPVQVMEFADFECPGCGQWATVTEPDVRERLINTGQISFRFFDFPLDMHPNAWPAHSAAACAADQGKFLEMHDAVFATQDKWNSYTTKNPAKPLRALAAGLGIDMNAWDACFDSQKHYPRIKANAMEGVRRGVNSTPTFVIGSKMYGEYLTFDQFKLIVDSALVEAAAAAKAAGKVPAKAATKP